MKQNALNSPRFIFTFVTIFLIANLSMGQEAGPKKNSFYANLGTDQSTVHTSVAYERLLFFKKSLETRLKLNYGIRSNTQRNTVYNQEVTQSYGSLTAVQILGIFELNAGIAIRRYKFGFNNTPIEFTTEYYKPKNDIQFYSNFGLRLDRNWFLIRAGIGNLDLIYLGIGANF